YLLQGPGHCSECHTPRDALGGLDQSRFLAGASNPEGGEGTVPNITPDPSGIGSWSASDIAYFLETGFTPDYDSVGGSMAAVQENWARLPAEDREAIAAYLKTVPARPAYKPEGRSRRRRLIPPECCRGSSRGSCPTRRRPESRPAPARRRDGFRGSDHGPRTSAPSSS